MNSGYNINSVYVQNSNFKLNYTREVEEGKGFSEFSILQTAVFDYFLFLYVIVWNA